MNHIFKKIDINVSKEILDNWVKHYIDFRGGIRATSEDLANELVIRPTGFNIEKIQEVIKRHTAPKKHEPDSKQKKHLNIYRSDLGELLMVLFFENELSEVIKSMF